jgi:splicing factor 3B subunit 1
VLIQVCKFPLEVRFCRHFKIKYSLCFCLVETPHNSGWAETPKVDRLDDDDMKPSHAQLAAAAAAAQAAKKRSRWDETPTVDATQMMASGTGAVQMTPNMQMTPSYPDITPSGATPSGVRAMNMTTPLPSQVPMTPEQMQAFRWEREIDERNRPLGDEELDSLFPPGYKILPPPDGYVPIRTPARKLLATPTPMNSIGAFKIMATPERNVKEDVQELQPQGANLPLMKPDDLQYFNKLLVSACHLSRPQVFFP